MGKQIKLWGVKKEIRLPCRTVAGTSRQPASVWLSRVSRDLSASFRREDGTLAACDAENSVCEAMSSVSNSLFNIQHARSHIENSVSLVSKS